MPLRPGSSLGTYEVVAQIGTGGMGEVYKARDPNLDRYVAIKVLPPGLAENPDFLARFQREAKAIAALNHPNLVGIYELGQDGPHRYAVMELLEGETLGALLGRGPLPPRRAVELAGQIARGMAAAHEKGIIHRDLKPDNLWITREGRIKILDFGLAKQTRGPGQGNATEALSLGPQTEHGMILGTVGYMSPEQVKGEPVDHRSDIFSFGVVVYEMLSGHRAFRGDTPIQTMNAILEHEPEELRVAKGHLPPALEHLVLHCLEKRPENRFQSMHDLAYDLDHLSTHTDASAPFLAPFAPANRGTSRKWAALGAVLVLGTGLAGWRLGHPAPRALVFTPLTFGTAPVWDARFTRDGGSVVYTLSGHDAAGTTIQSLSLDNPLSRQVLGRNNALAALSRTNELAALTGLTPAQGRQETFTGTLGRSPLGGALPRAITGHVVAADWDPRGNGLALVRDQGLGGMQIEFPEGKVLAKVEPGWFSHLRFSPDGRHLAVLRHPVFGDDMGSVVLVDPATGAVRELTRSWSQVRGLAWRGDGEIWFTGALTVNRDLYGVDLGGHLRTVLSAPADLDLADLAPDGRALLTSGSMTLRIFTCEVGKREGVDLTIKSYSTVRSASLDGRQLIIDDQTTEGPEYPMYVCSAEGGMPTPLGFALSATLVPGAGKVFIIRGKPAAPTAVLMTLATGQEEAYQLGDLKATTSEGAKAARTGDILLLQGTGGAPARIWKLSAKAAPVAVGPPLPPDTSDILCHDPKGQRVLVVQPDGAVSWVDLAEPDGVLHPVLPPDRRNLVAGFSEDGVWLYVAVSMEAPVTLDRVNIATGRREPYRKLELPAQQAPGFTGVLSADGKRWIGQTRQLSAGLYLVEGLK